MEMSIRLFENFFEEINWFTDVLSKIYNTKDVTLRTKREIHEAYVLKIQVTWEIFAENLLVQCLKLNTSQYAEYKDIKLSKRLSTDVCRALISGIEYFNVKGADHLKKIAKTILAPSCNPFKEIPSDISRKINEFYIFRNYIAHQSQKAKRSLSKIYTDVYDIIGKFPSPGEVLLTKVPTMKEQIFFADYINSFIAAAHTIKHFMEPIA